MPGLFFFVKLQDPNKIEVYSILQNFLTHNQKISLISKLQLQLLFAEVFSLKYYSCTFVVKFDSTSYIFVIVFTEYK